MHHPAKWMHSQKARAIQNFVRRRFSRPVAYFDRIPGPALVGTQAIRQALAMTSNSTLTAAPQTTLASPSRPDYAGTSDWHARLELHFAARGARTTLVHRAHEGPLRVQRPFYPEGGVCHVYVVHPPGGIVGGDRLAIQLRASAGAHALVTTPAAGKFYRSQGREATQRVDIDIADATLEWLPQETIFYRDARARVRTRVRLGAGAKFVGWEIGCLGLAARGETLGAGVVTQSFEVWRDGAPLLLDRLHLDSASSMLNARWGLAAQPVIGTLVAGPIDAAMMAALRERAAAFEAADGVLLSLTMVDGLLVGRALAAHADAVRRRFLALWQELRPQLTGCPAVIPRIWAT